MSSSLQGRDLDHLHNTSVDLMALHDNVERLRGALAVALLVAFSTCDKRRRARSLDEWALVSEVLEDSKTVGRRRKERKWRRFPREVHSGSPPTLIFLPGPNPFFLFGTKNLVRVKLMATILFRHGFDRRSGCVLIFLQTSLSVSMRGRYNNEIAE